MAQSKKDQLRAAFLRGEHLTPLIALNRYRCMSLSQRVGNFKTEGLNIKSKFVEGQPYKEYWLQTTPEQLPLELAA
jgi:hypothetical protein